MTRPDSAATLERVAVPMRMIVGAEDTVTPPADAEAMRLAVTGSDVVVIPGAGHMANLEAPGAFNDAVRTFLPRCRA